MTGCQVTLLFGFFLTLGAQAADRTVVLIPGSESGKALPALRSLSPEKQATLKEYQKYQLEVALRLNSAGTKVTHLRLTGNGSWPVAAAKSSIKEKVRYSFPIGQNNFGGFATLTKSRGKYRVTLPLQIAGGILFAQSSPQEAQEWTGAPELPPADYFLKGARSIEDIPALKQRVLEIIAEVQSLYQTPFFELEILPTFIKDESKILDREELEYGKGDTHTYVTSLIHGLQKHSRKTRKMAVFINPVGNRDAVSPTSWNIFMDAYATAHEIGHLLGIASEGFFFQDYSPVGLMNDEYALDAVKRLVPGEKPRFDIIDFNTMMSAIVPYLSPEVPLDLASEEFAGTHRALLKDNRGDYYGFTPGKRKALAEQAVRSWFGIE